MIFLIEFKNRDHRQIYDSSWSSKGLGKKNAICCCFVFDDFAASGVPRIRILNGKLLCEICSNLFTTEIKFHDSSKPQVQGTQMYTYLESSFQARSIAICFIEI